MYIKSWWDQRRKTKTVHVLCSHSINNIQEVIDKYNNRNTKLGELGNPNRPKINLDKVSHMVKHVFVKNGKIYAETELMDSPCGLILQGLYREGTDVNYGFRGTGRYELHRVEDYELHAIDAFMPNVPYEDKL